MMNAKECRAKAAEALVRATDATDPDVRATYNDHAREWTALALTADVQDKLEIDLTGRNDDSDKDSDRQPV